MSEPYEILVTVVDLEGNKGVTGATGIQGVPGQVTNATLTSEMALKANVASPTFTGTPAAPTAATNTNTTQIATTAHARANRAELEAVDALKAPLASPTLTGTPAAPTAATSTNTTQIATTAYVRANRAELEAVDAVKAPIVSPELTGTPAAPTPSTADNTTKIATTAHVRANRAELQVGLDLKTTIANPSFTGNVVVPDAVDDGAMVQKVQMEAAIAEADAELYPHISPIPPENNIPGRLWMKTPENHTAINIGGDNFAPLWPPTDNRAVNSKAAIELLEEAVGWWDAAYAVPGEQYVKNRGSGGSALDARYGTTAGNTIIQDGKAVLPGTGGYYLSVPDDTTLDITGDIEIAVRASATDWTPGLVQTLASKHGASGQRSWILRLEVDGSLSFHYSANGSTVTVVYSIAVLPFSDIQTGWVKLVFDANNGSAGTTTKFYYASDEVTEPTVWTQLGTDRVTATAISLFASTATVSVGATSEGFWPWVGTIYRAIVRNGIGGTTVLDVDCSVAADHVSTFYARTGQLVTVNPSGIDASEPLFLPHTGDNYLASVDAESRTSANGLSLTFAGDAEMLVRCSYRNWQTSNVETAIWAQFGSIYNRSAGQIHISINTSGGSGSASMTGVNPFNADQIVWLRWRRIASSGVTTLDWAPNSVQPPSTGWVNIINTTFRAGEQLVSVVDIGVGSSGIGAVTDMNGDIYRTIIRNGIDGPTVFDFNAATDITSSAATSFTATTGQTVTVNRATTGRKTTLVTRPVWLLGSDDHLEVLDNPLINFDVTKSFSVLIICKMWHSANYSSLISKRLSATNTNYGWAILTPNSLRLLVEYRGGGVTDDWAATLPSPSFSAGQNILAALIHSSSGSNKTVVNNVETVSTDALIDMTNTESLLIGKGNTGGDGFNFEVYAAAIFDRALTTEEIALINNFYGTV
jgi:hypothetical protein